jgi:hypothetical protein
MTSLGSPEYHYLSDEIQMQVPGLKLWHTQYDIIANDLAYNKMARSSPKTSVAIRYGKRDSTSPFHPE